MSPKSPSKEYEEQMREEDELNKQYSDKRTKESIDKFYIKFRQQTKRYPPKEKQYRKSILTSTKSTKKGGKRRKPRKTKKHRKKKSL